MSTTRLTSTGLVFPDSTVLNSKYGIVPQNTVSLFYQISSPIGWTQITTQNNKALRVVNTGGGTTGGPPDSSTSGAFSSIFTSVSNTNLSASMPASVSSLQLPISQLPSHAHGTGGGGLQARLDGSGQVPTGPGYLSTNPNTGNNGGNGSHTHPVSTSLTYGYSYNIAVRYLDIILCRFA
jgi:hypothetical protein